jgi:hypothetical protein
MLKVQLPGKPEHLRLSFVSARDDAGADLAEFLGSWGQHQFWHKLRVRNPTNVHVTIAIVPDYPIHFTLQPKFEPERGTPGTTSTTTAR